jgi:hypothetical protein
MTEVTPSGRDVLERLARGAGPGGGRGNALLKLERDGLIRLASEERRRWELTQAGWAWLERDDARSV